MKRTLGNILTFAFEIFFLLARVPSCGWEERKQGGGAAAADTGEAREEGETAGGETEGEGREEVEANDEAGQDLQRRL